MESTHPSTRKNRYRRCTIEAVNTLKLPSKQFLIRGGIATGIVALILVVQTTWFQKLFNRNGSLSADTLTVGDLVAQDSNQNGIPDWEEKLWGLDPAELYTGDMSNREIIESKKRALGLTPTGDQNLNQTDRLARELFSISTALGQSGQLDSGTVANAATGLGASVQINTVTDRYSFKQVRTIATTQSSLRAYQKTTAAILSKYAANTADIDVVIRGLETGDFSGLPALAASAATYRQIARELSVVTTPVGVAQYHLDMMNGFAGVGASFDYLTELEEDGIVGLNGIAIYREYSLKLDAALFDINQYLSEYGIL